MTLLLSELAVRFYFFSLVLWQITSTEKLKARANAIASHRECFSATAKIVIIRQNKLATTVKAFFSEKYFFIQFGLAKFNEAQKYCSFPNEPHFPALEIY